MRDTTLHWLIDHLFADPHRGVYAILDGASIEGLLEQLWQFAPSHACLFAGKLEPSVAEAAPYLIELEPRSPFLRWLLERGWGQHWGIFATSEADLETVRKHLKTFLLVMDPDGNQMFFRYYDPRVLRVYLPTCNEEETEHVLGPLSTFFLEDGDPMKLLAFQRGDGGPVCRSMDLPDPGT